MLSERAKVAELGEAYRHAASDRLGRLEHNLRDGAVGKSARVSPGSALDRGVTPRGGGVEIRVSRTSELTKSCSTPSAVFHDARCAPCVYTSAVAPVEPASFTPGSSPRRVVVSGFDI